MSWLSGQRKSSVAHQSQRIVAQMHEILQNKNAKITKLETVIAELQDACTSVLEEELEALHNHRKRLEDEMASVDELIRAKSEKLAEIREETATIINIVNEDDITKAVEVQRKASKKRSSQRRSPRPIHNISSDPHTEGKHLAEVMSAAETTEMEEDMTQHQDDCSRSTSNHRNSDGSLQTYQQLLEDHEIRSEISAEEDDFESLDPRENYMADGTPVDLSCVTHQGVDEQDADHTDEDVIEGLELLTTLRETDISVMFVIHRDVVEDVTAVSLRSPTSNPTLQLFKIDCEQTCWPKEEISFLERTTFYRFVPLAGEEGYIFAFHLSLLPERNMLVSSRSEEQYVCHTTIAGVEGAILDRIFVSSKSTWGFSLVGEVDLFGRHAETGALLHEKCKVWENVQLPQKALTETRP